jgi:hypothetical protein
MSREKRKNPINVIVLGDSSSSEDETAKKKKTRKEKVIVNLKKLKEDESENEIENKKRREKKDKTKRNLFKIIMEMREEIKEIKQSLSSNNFKNLKPSLVYKDTDLLNFKAKDEKDYLRQVFCCLFFIFFCWLSILI